jgi:protein HOOK3
MLMVFPEEIDPQAFHGDLPSPDASETSSESWTACLDNLEHLYLVLTTYIVGQCNRVLPLSSGAPNLRAIARDISEKDTFQLLKLVFLSAVFGRFSMDYFEQLFTFSESQQQQFLEIMKEAQEPEPEIKATPPSNKSSGLMHDDDGNLSKQQDPELVYEERIAELLSFNKKLEHETVELKEDLENMHDRHIELQKDYDNLKTQQQDTAERLDSLRSGKGEQTMLGIMRVKMQQQESVIASLEGKIDSLEDDKSLLKEQCDVLQPKADRYQEMEDEVDELKLEREQLQRKANAADKYKQKLQHLTKVEDENEGLRFRVTEMQRQLKDFDSDHLNNSDVNRENEELKRLVSGIEQDLSESNKARKRAEFEKSTFEARCHSADEQATRWHAKAEELMAQLNEYAGVESPSTPRANVGHSADDTENATEEQGTNLAQELADMEINDQDMISADELQRILTVMKTHTRDALAGEKSSSIEEQQKLATKIEKTREIAQQLIQVIEFLSRPRVEFVGVKDLDENTPYKSVSPRPDDVASLYGSASQSRRGSTTSLSAATRRQSTASLQSTHSVSQARKPSILRNIFGNHD